MVDEAKLNEYIERSGKKKTFIARKAGLTPQGFRNKVKNVYDFTTSEITAICAELDITDPREKEQIFFAPDVAENGNTDESAE